ncbi:MULTISPECIES: hypothetical protein [unclassified Janthinobacterium]|uniref:hypothetical protein n=1 Tax=unclassified Janthinobacterium TaxID=2610881 RepID=UPI001E2FA43D|nr:MULTISPECIES: hypothetical protein [unclassified Janthinobacterium]MCC7643612.1 hypothetical protein [Janthinobacterium sp. EB271-G4-3-1]MCC7691420.1 hypothetical protein [Janthinobacterium sp. EB271-G4-3-2]
MNDSEEQKRGGGGKIPKTIRVHDDVWKAWGDAAQQMGMTRSAFIKQATAMAAELVASGGRSYFVMCPSGTRQNTRTNLLEQKSTSVEVRASGAKGVASAKRAPTKAPISRNPKG